MRWLPNLITLVRVPVIVLLVLPVFSLGWDDTWLALALYLAGCLSHGLDGTLAERLVSPYEDRQFWHKLDTEWLSLPLQLAAIAYIFHHQGTEWWLAAIVIVAYVAITGLIQVRYIDPRKNYGLPYYPVVLYGSAVVWLTLGGILAAQTPANDGLIAAVVGFMFAFGSLHSRLHPQVWHRWHEEHEGMA